MFDFYLTHKPALSSNSSCIIVAVTDNQLTASAQMVDSTLKQMITRLLKRGSISSKLGDTTSIPLLNNTNVDHLIIIGAGKNKKITEYDFKKVIQAAGNELLKASVKEAHLYLTELEVGTQQEQWKIRLQVEVLAALSYPINSLKSQSTTPYLLEKINLFSKTSCEEAISQGLAIALGVKKCKDLGNLPANICTPSYLAQQALELDKQYQHLSTTVLNEAQMKKLGMNTLLSVGAGSAQASKLAVMHYRGADKEEKPHVLIGKGISFDTGGTFLKNREGMALMKYDMCGSAAVIGAMCAVAHLGLPLNVIGVIACAENMPGSQATKPSDVVTSMSGKTVEILNTDAEGRLVLCDALTYVERFNPASVVDVATLTGACVVALGHYYSGLFANNQALADSLLQAAQQTMDKAWQLPLSSEDMKQLDSNFADIANMGDGTAASVVAALFLSRFAESYPWAHLDISGSAKQTSPHKEATGRPVPLLVQYLINLCEL